MSLPEHVTDALRAAEQRAYLYDDPASYRGALEEVARALTSEATGERSEPVAAG